MAMNTTDRSAQYRDTAVERTYRRFDLVFSIDPLIEAIAVGQEAVAWSTHFLANLPSDASVVQSKERWIRDSVFMAALLRLASDRAATVLAAANWVTMQMDDR